MKIRNNLLERILLFILCRWRLKSISKAQNSISQYLMNNDDIFICVNSKLISIHCFGYQNISHCRMTRTLCLSFNVSVQYITAIKCTQEFCFHHQVTASANIIFILGINLIYLILFCLKWKSAEHSTQECRLIQ